MGVLYNRKDGVASGASKAYSSQMPTQSLEEVTCVMLSGVLCMLDKRKPEEGRRSGTQEQMQAVCISNGSAYLRHCMKVMTEAVLPKPITSASTAFLPLDHILRIQLTACHMHTSLAQHPISCHLLVLPWG